MELTVVGDSSRLVPSKQHREVPGKELGQNGDQGREGLCLQAGPVWEPAPGTPEDPCTHRGSPVAMKDTLRLLLAEKAKLGQEVSRVQDPSGGCLPFSLSLFREGFGNQ